MWSTAAALDPLLGRAAMKARELRHAEITLEHLAWAVLVDPKAARVLAGCGGDPGFLAHELHVYLEQRVPPERSDARVREPRCHPEVVALLERVVTHAISAERDTTGAAELLAQLWQAPPGFVRGLINAHGVPRLALLRQLSHGTSIIEPELGWRRPGPRGYHLVLHNDDYTTREFVVLVLCEVLGFDEKEAADIMLRVHRRGRAKLGPYAADRARAAASDIHRRAERAEFPLRCSLEPA